MATGAVCPNRKVWFQGPGPTAECPTCGYVHVQKRQRQVRWDRVSLLPLPIGLVLLYLGFTKNEAIPILVGGYLILPALVLHTFWQTSLGINNSPALNPGFEPKPPPQMSEGSANAVIWLLEVLIRIFIFEA